MMVGVGGECGCEGGGVRGVLLRVAAYFRVERPTDA